MDENGLLSEIFETRFFHMTRRSLLYIISAAYNDVTYTDKLSEYYCSKTPFLMAFITLILFWIFIPLIWCFMTCVCFSTICYILLPQEDSTAPESNPNAESGGAEHGNTI